LVGPDAVNVAAVRFGPVQHPDFLNLELDLGFSSGNLLNFGLDPGSGPVQVRTWFEPVFSSHVPDALEILSRSSPASIAQKDSTKLVDNAEFHNLLNCFRLMAV
jgi:hypothetical protein